MAGWSGAAESDLKAAGAEKLPDGRTGVRLKGWHIESFNGPILNSSAVQQWEETLKTTHLPEMVFGESSLILVHRPTGTKLHFNALDALKGWKEEALPPVEVPAAAQWKFRCKPSEQVVLDYDYTFTTPYCGSEAREHNTPKAKLEDSCLGLCWEDTDEQINLAALSSQTEPILFYDEVVLYEDELADNGVSLLTVKVRVMPSCWFLLLRFWLRVDGVLMRLRDTRIYCAFDETKDEPLIIREINWRESPINVLSAKGYLADPAAYGDPNLIKERLPIVMHKNQKLKISR
ncbi:TIP41-like protein [Carex littledalei]|uniref:TIP41-like protein n=1 Tax=Carex littledalei TaxID=544730 RepID=A0A833V4U5_9POAL|nr:TIP41-like protein [Carex littledalei]